MVAILACKKHELILLKPSMWPTVICNHDYLVFNRRLDNIPKVQDAFSLWITKDRWLCVGWSHSSYCDTIAKSVTTQMLTFWCSVYLLLLLAYYIPMLYHYCMLAHERGIIDRLYACVVYYCRYTSVVSTIMLWRDGLLIYIYITFLCCIIIVCRHTSVVAPIGCMHVMFIIVGTRAWYHRSCLEEMAYSAGVHFFKCPLCNNIDEWQEEMLQCGIFIPDRWMQETLVVVI